MVGSSSSGNIGARSTIIRNQSSARTSKKQPKMRTMTAYGGVFVLVLSFLAAGYQGEHAGLQTGASVAQATPTTTTSPALEKVSVDQLTAANAVTDLAEVTNLPVAGDLRETTTTLYIKKQLSQADTEVISKPQIVQPDASSSRGVTTYVAKEGDTMETIAKQFNISSQTLRWANNTTSDAVEVGKTLTVPLTDGVLYTVKDGDTIASIADKYKVQPERIVLYNDLDSDAPLAKDTQLVLPNGDLPETERPGYEAPRPQPVYTGGGTGGMSGSTTDRSYGYGGGSAGNRYALGNCTWYAYERRMQLGRPIGGLWGNATSWAASARGAGFVVNNTPAPGAIIQTSYGGGGYGHVGIVERVDEANIYISDMNFAGYNIVTHRTIPLSQAGAYNFIH